MSMGGIEKYTKKNSQQFPDSSKRCTMIRRKSANYADHNEITLHELDHGIAEFNSSIN